MCCNLDQIYAIPGQELASSCLDSKTAGATSFVSDYFVALTIAQFCAFRLKHVLYGQELASC